MINTCATVDPDHRSARRKWSISETGVGCCYDGDDDGNDNDDDDDNDGGVMVLVRTEDRGLKSLQLVAKKLVVGGWLKLATPRKRSFREEIGEAFGGIAALHLLFSSFCISVFMFNYLPPIESTDLKSRWDSILWELAATDTVPDRQHDN